MKRDVFGSLICDGEFPPPDILTSGGFSHDIRSCVVIFNPANSGVKFTLTGGSYAWTVVKRWLDTVAGGATVFFNGHGIDMIRLDAMPPGNIEGTPASPLSAPYSKALAFCDFGESGLSPIMLHSYRAQGVNLPSGYLFKELWEKQNGNSRNFDLDRDVIIHPGQGILARPAQPSCYNILNVAGYIEPIE